MSYIVKQIIKEVKFPIYSFGCFRFILLKRLCPITIFSYATSGQTKHKCFIAWDYASSHAINPYPKRKSRHENGDETRKWSLIMMICTPEHRSLNTKGQLLMRTAIMWQCPTHPKPQDNLTKHPTKLALFQEPYEKVSQKFSLRQIDHVTVRIRIIIWSPMRIRVRSSLTSLISTPRSIEYDPRHNPQLSCNDNYR